TMEGPHSAGAVLSLLLEAYAGYYSGMVLRVSVSGFIQPCLPSRVERPPSGPGWVHEIKHDGFRLMVRRDGAGVRLITRNGHDWSGRFPLIAEAAGALKARSFLMDGEAVACDRDGLPSFDRLRYRRGDGTVFLFAFDLLELDGRDLRREPYRDPQGDTGNPDAPGPPLIHAAFCLKIW